MIDLNQNLILINAQSKTAEIELCQYKEDIGRYIVVFRNSSKQYFYKRENIVWMRNPSRLEPKNYQVKHKGYLCDNIIILLEFSSGFKMYYHIKYANGMQKDYTADELEIVESCLSEPNSKIVFEYFKEVAEANALKAEDGQKILAIQYRSIGFLAEELAIAPYLFPDKYKAYQWRHKDLIFPFGCNTSQLMVVQRAFENQISVIQGPPGTGKTQTILNIIANILMMGKSVLVVSNNNSAIENVLEKLAKYHLDFLVAPLGCSDNKRKFVEAQSVGRGYPEELSEWKDESVGAREFANGIKQQVAELKDIFAKQERLAICKQELSDLELEWKHFREELGGETMNLEISISSKHILGVLNEFQEHLEASNNSWLGKIKWWFRKLVYQYVYKIGSDFLQLSLEDVIQRTQSSFYMQKIKELTNEVEMLKNNLGSTDAALLMQQLSEQSIKALKNNLYQRYAVEHESYMVTEVSLKQGVARFLEEFPVVLSTTFSARTSLRNAVYDYLIMDEASQVAVETGVLALSCAKNAIIVGDMMQLSNVVTKEDKEMLDAIFKRYDVNKGYNCGSMSFLQSVLEIIPSVPQTLLREHYRCAPRIINFCNQKFYNGELIIMTADKEGEDTISAIKTVKGNHSRVHTNQREIDVICQEVIPSLAFENNEIGIIAPYNKQVDAIKQAISCDIDVATVHKFQGREKEAIILSVVDDQITEFTDDPNLLNVAVSRAKRKFCLVVSGNKQETHGNISDLLGYIEYSNGTVTDSRVYSIFDLLYKQYTDARINYLKEHKRISEYDSENLVYVLINNILKGNQMMCHLDVVSHYPMNILIRDFSLLTEEEKRYASHNATHLDFLIYNRVSKKPLLAVEVDGWAYHQQGSRQIERDKLKNHILSLYGIQLLRLSTIGSGERTIIENKIKNILLL